MTWQFVFPRKLTFLAMKQKMRAVPVQRFGLVFRIRAHRPWRGPPNKDGGGAEDCRAEEQIEPRVDYFQHTHRALDMHSFIRMCVCVRTTSWKLIFTFNRECIIPLPFILVLRSFYCCFYFPRCLLFQQKKFHCYSSELIVHSLLNYSTLSSHTKSDLLSSY